jgi:hypothetical protein
MKLTVHIDRPARFSIHNLSQDFVGWVSVPCASTLKQFVFWIDGKPVDVSFFRREDVAQAFPDCATSGWAFYLDHATLLSGSSRTLTLEVTNGAEVVLKRVFLKSRLLMDPSNDSPFFFMHIPKTAGTALRQFVDYVFQDMSSLFIYGDYPGVDAGAARKLTRTFLDSREIVYGHFGYDFTDAFSVRHPKIITIFREPKKLLASYAKYHAGGDKEFFDNPFVRHITGVGYDLPYGSVSEKHFEQAVEILDRCCYVLHADNLQGFADTVTDLFGMEKFMIPHINQNDGFEAGQAPSLPARFQFDQQLYDMSRTKTPNFLRFLNAVGD